MLLSEFNTVQKAKSTQSTELINPELIGLSQPRVQS